VLPRERHTVPAARTVLTQALSAANVRPAVIDELSIAMSEACTNAVRHAAGDEYRVEIDLGPQAVRIIVADLGPGFDVPDPITMPPAGAASGRGLALMSALVDELAVTCDGPAGGTRVVMTRSLANVAHLMDATVS
jgi:serine/threonine-protein kinase RsbW